MGGHGEGLQRPCGDQPETRVRRGQPQASEGRRHFPHDQKINPPSPLDNQGGLLDSVSGRGRRMGFLQLINMNSMKKYQCLNGPECRPQAPVAEAGAAHYEGSLGDAPKTLFIFLATPYPLR